MGSWGIGLALDLLRNFTKEFIGLLYFTKRTVITITAVTTVITIINVVIIIEMQDSFKVSWFIDLND